VNGIGMIAARVFVMDPADGFPAGAPSGMPETLTWHSYGHMAAAGSIAFVALISACYVLGATSVAPVFGATPSRPRVAGTALLIGNGWAMSGGRAGSLNLAVGAITAMLWISTVAGRYRPGR
jgi:hypothetical protein